MDKSELLYLRHNGLTVDLFAGGGGMSVGWEQSLMRPIDIALNHDRYAVTLHAENHPKTVHLCQDIYEVDPNKVIKGRPTFWIHASPSCTQFSRSRKALPAEKQLREMAWKIIDWVDASRPVIVTLENVAEFTEWGPLGEDGFPLKDKKGETWNAFVQAFRDRGYTVEWRILDSADYGATTQRLRLFVIARRDGIENIWPTKTHGPGAGRPWKSAAECINWNIKTPSIFSRKRPLADATMKRIHKGIRKFVYEKPFIVPQEAIVGDGENRADLVAAFMAQNNADLAGRRLDKPSSTICTKGAGQSLVTVSFVSVMRKNVIGCAMESPVKTMTASGGHLAEVRVQAEEISAFCTGYFSQGGSQLHDLREPTGTITTRDRFGLVMIKGKPYQMTDIGYRMLSVEELWALQTFPRDYKTKIIANGKPLTDEVAKRLIGNSVVPVVAKAFSEAILQSIDMHDPMKIAA